MNGSNRLGVWLGLAILLGLGGYFIFSGKGCARIAPFLRRSGASKPANSSGLPEDVHNLMKTVEKLKKPKGRPKVAIVPFTDSKNMITTDSLILYHPAFFRTMYTPERRIDNVYETYMMNLEARWSLLRPGMHVADETAQSFSQAFGCDTVVTTSIDSGDGRGIGETKATVTIKTSGKPPVVKTLTSRPNELPQLPGLIAEAILTQVLRKEATPAVLNYARRPAARDVESLRLQGLCVQEYYTKWPVHEKSDWIRASGDESGDWFQGTYANYLNEHNEKADAIQLALQMATQNPSHGRYGVQAAGLLKAAGKTNDAIAQVRHVLDRDPGNIRAVELFADIVWNRHGPIAAEPIFEKLEKLDPDSAYIQFREAEFHLALAWKHRGGGYINTVTEDGWKQMSDHVEKARKNIYRSLGLDPFSSEAWSQLIEIAKLQQWPSHKVYEVFHQAVKYTPNDRGLYESMSEYLLPIWFGSNEALRDFWAETRRIPNITNPYIYTIPVYGHYRMARVEARQSNGSLNPEKFREYFAQPGVWDDLAAGYDRFFAMAPNNYKQHSLYAFYSACAGKWEVAFDHFERSQFNVEVFDMSPMSEWLKQYALAAEKTGHLDRFPDVCNRGIQLNKPPVEADWFRKELDRVMKESAK